MDRYRAFFFVSIRLFLFDYCHSYLLSYLVVRFWLGVGQCMREWLTMAGAQTSSLTSLEEKARYYHLSESKITQEHKAILNALLPGNIVEKLKVCTRKLF